MRRRCGASCRTCRRGRNESLFYLPNEVDVEAAFEFLDKHNRTRPPERPATLFHLLLRAVRAGHRACAARATAS